MPKREIERFTRLFLIERTREKMKILEGFLYKMNDGKAKLRSSAIYVVIPCGAIISHRLEEEQKNRL